MPKTITLTTARVQRVVIDIPQQRVIVGYFLLDAPEAEGGRTYEMGELILWRTMPDLGTQEDGTPVPVPDTWQVLPPGVIASLSGLIQHINQRLGELVA